MNELRYYVRNPIALGEWRHLVHVVGYDETKGKSAPYVVPRGHIIDAQPGAAPAIAKWTANRCLEPYDAKRHPDAVLEPVPEIPPAFPAWSYESARPGREIEAEIARAEKRR